MRRMTATWVALIARSRIISNQQYVPCSLYQTCLVRDSINAIRLTWRPKKDVRRSDKLTIEYRKQGECWRDNGEYGWRPVRVAISASIWAWHDLPNRAMMWMSHKRTNLRINKSEILFKSDTFFCNNILLDLAKYIHWITLPYLSFHHTTSFMGECWI